MVLLINADLINPPTSLQCFRTLTLVAKIYCSYDVLVESISDKDLYYRFLKKHGCMDFVDDIVSLGEESGTRIDRELRFAPTYLTDRITVDNLNYITDYIGFSMEKATKKLNQKPVCPWCEAEYLYSFEDTEAIGEFVIKKIINVFECNSNDRPWQSVQCREKADYNVQI